MASIVVCPEPLAARAGLEVLMKGGNAVDAAIAGSLAQGITDPMTCGIGGHGRLLIYLRKRNLVTIIDGMSRSGSKAIPGVFGYDPNKQLEDRVLRTYKVRDRENEIGYKASTVPGYVAAIGLAHEKYGKLPWKDLFTPAIKLAREGFRVYPYLITTGFIPEELPSLSATEAAKRIYTREGRPLRVGETLVQKDYGNTLEILSREGADSFYKGSVGQKIAEDFEKNGGLFTGEDLSKYRATEIKPIKVPWEGYEVYSDSQPGSGPMKLEALRALGEFDLAKLGWNSPEYLDVFSRIFQFVMNDRERYAIDPESDPNAEKNAEMMISEKHTKEIADLVKKGESAGSARPNNVLDHGIRLGASHITALDSEGNAVSFCHSIVHSSGVVTEGLGFLYNCHMALFDPRPNQRLSIRPWRVPVDSPSPMFVFKDSELLLSMGSSAGLWGSSAEIQTIANVFKFGMCIQEAVSVPRVHSDIYSRMIYVESNFPYPYPTEQLKQMGNTIVYSEYTGWISAILRDPKTNQVHGGTDPRSGGGLAYAS